MLILLSGLIPTNISDLRMGRVGTGTVRVIILIILENSVIIPLTLKPASVATPDGGVTAAH